MIRSIIFWAHLVCGVVAGLVIFTMSFTGVMLMYERQLQQWAAAQHYVPESEQQGRLSLEQLLQIPRAAHAEPATLLVLTNDPGAPVTLRAGRQAPLHLNPYTGAELHPESPALAAFFAWNTGFHRWFNVEGEKRALARQVTGVSNVLFLFLVLSGLYLWLPGLWRWATFRVRLWFRASYPNSKTRDYHWHHIFGIWAALPLLAVVYSGAVISYPWAANLLYLAFGAEIPAAPVPGGAPPGAGQTPGSGGSAAAQTAAPLLSLDALVDRALAEAAGGWQRLNVTLPRDGAATIQIEIDRGNGAQAHKRHTLSLNRVSGAIEGVRTFADQSEAQRLRGIARFLHTGEVLGFWGQTLAGLASLAALFMVWTGFALSWRRLVQPLFRRK